MAGSNNPEVRVEIHNVCGVTYYHRGDKAAAHEHAGRQAQEMASKRGHPIEIVDAIDGHIGRAFPTPRSTPKAFYTWPDKDLPGSTKAASFEKVFGHS